MPFEGRFSGADHVPHVLSMQPQPFQRPYNLHHRLWVQLSLSEQPTNVWHYLIEKRGLRAQYLPLSRQIYSGQVASCTRPASGLRVGAGSYLEPACRFCTGVSSRL